MRTKTIHEFKEFISRNKGLIEHNVDIDIHIPWPYKGCCIFSIEKKPLVKIVGPKNEIINMIEELEEENGPIPG